MENNNEFTSHNNGFVTKHMIKWLILSLIVVCIVLVLVFVVKTTVNSVSSDREALADFYRIDTSLTHHVGVSDHDNGITMKVLSTHSDINVTNILISFTKDDGSSFLYSWNPNLIVLSKGIEIKYNGSFIVSKTDDDKTLLCYVTLLMERPNRDITLKVDGFLRQESMVDGETIEDMNLSGSWSASFELKQNENASINLEILEHPVINVFYKDLSLNSISLTSTSIVIDIDVLKEYEITEQLKKKALISSYSSSSSGYYGVYLQLVYNDGSTSQQYDLYISENPNIKGYLYTFINEIDQREDIKSINLQNIAEIHIGNIVIPMKNN